MKAKEIMRPALVLLAICFIITLLLALIQMWTAPKIEAINLKNEQEARQRVLPQAVEFTPLAIEGQTLYLGLGGDGQTVGYVATTHAKGYGGDVAVMTGMDTSLTVTGVEILSHNETPGLGAKAQDKNFTSRFLQPAKDGLTLVKGTAGEGQVEAITGATITSKAVTQAVNDAAALAAKALEGGGQ